jgi:hypothetical protein
MKLLFAALIVAYSYAFCEVEPIKNCGPKNLFPCLEPATGERLIGGTVPEPGKFPNSVWIGNCSATVIGEKVLATASHCVSNGASVSFTKDGHRYKGVCSRHPEYRYNSTADWALCLLSEVVEGGKYERLNVSNEIKVGTVLLNSGYGCRKWGGDIDGKFRIGNAPVVDVPSGKDYDITTKGSVALCSGDSGGASYLEKPSGGRFVVGVNSRSNTTTTSYLPSWSADTAVKWGKEWADAKGVKICGYHVDAKGCRDSVPEPEKDFSVEGKTISVKGSLKPDAKYKVEDARKLTQEMVDILDKQP